MILVLTIVGLGVAYFAQIEEGLSGNARLTRACVLRGGGGPPEGRIRHQQLGRRCRNRPLVHPDLRRLFAPLNVPGGGWQGIILHATDPEDGDAEGLREPDGPGSGNVVDRGSYSIYVRNNPDDPSGLEAIDTDSVVLLISVGQVQGAGGRNFTKILEEQLLTGALGSLVGGQYLTNAGGTSSGAKSK